MSRLRSKVDLETSHASPSALIGDEVAGLLDLRQSPGAARILEQGLVFIDPAARPRLGATGADGERRDEHVEGLGFEMLEPAA